MHLNVNALITDLNITYRNLRKSYVVEPSSKYLELKTGANAVSLRIYGNDLYKRGEVTEALSMFTKSVAFSPEGSEELALAYANRSAVLFRLEDYVSCLLDINRALKGNYPKNLVEKLHERKKRALAQIEASPHKNRIRGDETNPVVIPNKKETEEWQKLCVFDNSLIPNASSKIKLEYDEKRGRHLTAAEDINVGEILSVEKFFVLKCNEHGQYCSYCLLKCDAAIPCSSCCQEMYCSEQCRTRANDAYHRIECKLLQFFDDKDDLKGIHSLAVRTLLIGTEQGTRLRNLMETISISSIFEEEVRVADEPYSYDYLSILKLGRNFDPALLKSHVDIVVKIIIVLQGLSFFGSDSKRRDEVWPDYLSEAELFTAALLINHLDTLKLKPFGVNGIERALNYGYTGSDKGIGGGVCSVQHLLTQSCNPNTRFFTRNREHVLYVSQPIKQGEKITSGLGRLFSLSSFKERAENLSSVFGITCDCEACINRWPIAPDLALRKIEIIVENKTAAIIDLMNFTDKIVLFGGTKNLRNCEIIKMITELLEMLHKYIKKPSMHIVFCEDFLVKFTMMTYSEYGRDYARAARKEKYVEWMVDTIANALLYDFKKAKLVDYAILPHLRYIQPTTYTLLRKI